MPEWRRAAGPSATARRRQRCARSLLARRARSRRGLPATIRLRRRYSGPTPWCVGERSGLHNHDAVLVGAQVDQLDDRRLGIDAQHQGRDRLWQAAAGRSAADREGPRRPAGDEPDGGARCRQDPLGQPAWSVRRRAAASTSQTARACSGAAAGRGSSYPPTLITSSCCSSSGAFEETQASMLAAKRASPSELRVLEAAVETCRHGYARRTKPSSPRATTLPPWRRQASHNFFLVSAVPARRALRAAGERHRDLRHRRPSRGAVAEHQAIYNAIRDGDPSTPPRSPPRRASTARLRTTPRNPAPRFG